MSRISLPRCLLAAGAVAAVFSAGAAASRTDLQVVLAPASPFVSAPAFVPPGVRPGDRALVAFVDCPYPPRCEVETDFE